MSGAESAFLDLWLEAPLLMTAEYEARDSAFFCPVAFLLNNVHRVVSREWDYFCWFKYQTVFDTEETLALFLAIVHCGKGNLKRSYRTPALEALSHPLSQPRESRAYSTEHALFPQYSTHLCNRSSPWAVQEVGAATPVFSLFRALRFGVGLAGIAGFPQPTLGSSGSQVWRLLCAL